MTAKQGLHILLVEDHEPNILVAGTLLETLGHRYDVARNGAEAVEKAAAYTFDLIMMDVQMPAMNGFEATKTIRDNEKSRHTNRVPIIGVTAHALVGDKERCLDAGMDDYMSKPFNFEDLEDKLEQLAGR